MLSNAEKHPSLKGVYIVYDANGYAFRVKRASIGKGWVALPSHTGKDNRGFRSDTLFNISVLISQSRI